MGECFYRQARLKPMRITQQTRRQSLDKVRETLGKRQAAVLYELYLVGEAGVTAGELARIMYDKHYFGTIERNNVHPRLNELERMEAAEICGKRKCAVSGKTCALYRAKQE